VSERDPAYRQRNFDFSQPLSGAPLPMFAWSSNELWGGWPLLAWDCCGRRRSSEGCRSRSPTREALTLLAGAYLQRKPWSRTQSRRSRALRTTTLAEPLAGGDLPVRMPESGWARSGRWSGHQHDGGLPRRRSRRVGRFPGTDHHVGRRDQAHRAGRSQSTARRARALLSGQGSRSCPSGAGLPPSVVESSAPSQATLRSQ